MRDYLDHPLLFMIVMTLLVLALAHLGNLGAKRLGWQGAASFFSLP